MLSETPPRVSTLSRKLIMLSAMFVVLLGFIGTPDTAYAQKPDPANCVLPPVYPTNQTAYVSVSGGNVISTVTFAGGPRTPVGLSAAIVPFHIGDGVKQAYLVVSSTRPLIWQFKGDTHKIYKLVVLGRRIDRSPILAGVQGVPSSKIVFLDIDDCFIPRQWQPQDALDNRKGHEVIADFLGRALDVNGEGDSQTSHVEWGNGKISVATGRFSQPPIPAQAPRGFNAEVWKELLETRHLRYLGLEVQSPSDIVSQGGMIENFSLPGPYGLARLVGSGYLERVFSGRYRYLMRDRNGKAIAWIEQKKNSPVPSGVSTEREPVYDWRLLKPLDGTHVELFGITRLLIPRNVTQIEDVGLSECTKDEGPLGERMFADHCP